MAGIGFELKKLFNKKSASGYFQAYFYTLVVTVGPFVMLTGLILLIQLMLKMKMSYFEVELYLVSMVYPFIFSQIAASGFAMLITRFISDRLYSHNYNEVMPSLLGMLALVLPISAIPAILFIYDAPLPFALKFSTYILYMELIVIWIQGVYLSALKDYMRIIRSYIYGILTALLLTAFILFAPFFQVSIVNVMVAMDIGFFIMAVMLMRNIRSFFSDGKKNYFLFLPYLDTHFTLVLTNLFYTVGLYAPNIIMWQGEWGISVANTYIYSPIYDVATFYAFLSILPLAAIFVVSTELLFYEKYKTYVTLITGKGNFKEIEDAREDMLQVLWSQICNLVEVQLAFSLLFLALGNYLLPKIGLIYSAVNIYNLLVLGAFCNGILQIIIIFLLYFEDRRGALASAAVFLLLNILFNFLCLQLGENTYGFGFFLAALISVVFALQRLHYYAVRIDYFIYCSVPVFNNVKSGFWSKLKATLLEIFSHATGSNKT